MARGYQRAVVIECFGMILFTQWLTSDQFPPFSCHWKSVTACQQQYEKNSYKGNIINLFLLSWDQQKKTNPSDDYTKTLMYISDLWQSHDIPTKGLSQMQKELQQHWLEFSGVSTLVFTWESNVNPALIYFVQTRCSIVHVWCTSKGNYPLGLDVAFC